MKHLTIYEQVEIEIKRQRKNPFPVHIVAQAARVSINANLILAAADNIKYVSKKNRSEYLKVVESSTIRTIAASILFLENLNKDGTTDRIRLQKLFTDQHREVERTEQEAVRLSTEGG